MRYYIGLDISNKQTSVCVINENGKVIRQMKVHSDPNVIGNAIKKLNLNITLVGLEAGALSHWILEGLLEQGIPCKCIDTRRMSAIIQTNINKTDRNDAKEIALAMKNANYREVHQKSHHSIEIKVLMSARNTLVEKITSLKNTVRGLLKTYGVTFKIGCKDEKFIEAVNSQLSFDQFLPEPRSIEGFEAIKCLLNSINFLIAERKKLDQKVEDLCKNSEVIKRFTAIPGVGPITILSYMTTIDEPKRFKSSRSVGAYLGLTPEQYSSGESIRQGKISKSGANHTRTLLISAARDILESKKWSKLKAWGLKIARKKGMGVATIAVARKLAVIMHRMWINGSEFIFGEPKTKELNETEKLEKILKEAKNKKKKEKPKKDSTEHKELVTKVA